MFNIRSAFLPLKVWAAILCVVAPVKAFSADPTWTKELSLGWYNTTQGSRLLPESWFQALERANEIAPFAEQINLAKYNFILREDSKLPIGFVVDRQDDRDLTFSKQRWYVNQKGNAAKAEPWIGFNCAACHTAEIFHAGQRMVIDGAPAAIDYQTFIEDLNAALLSTQSNVAKWERFAGKVLSGKDTSANRMLLQQSFDEILRWQTRTENMNRNISRYGYSRVDAFGHIYNKVLMFANPDLNIGNPSDAPVSFPFLWNIHRQNKVQWNGSAKNSKFKNFLRYGAIGRNTGEVLGVFGDIKIRKFNIRLDALGGYISSVSVKNLNKLEKIVEKMPSPVWPQFLPALSTERVTRGKQLFVQLQCHECHKSTRDTPLNEPTEVMLHFADTRVEDLTDTKMACNAYTASGPSGRMQGAAKNLFGVELIGEKARVLDMLGLAVAGAMVYRIDDLIDEVAGTFFDINQPTITFEREVSSNVIANRVAQFRCLQSANEKEEGTDILSYKARPLEGIWATAPYLHNGSVPTLYDLLLPPDKRPKQFVTGSKEFDAVKVGFSAGVTTGKTFKYDVMDSDGNVIPGNSNSGHNYGVDKLLSEERLDLLEYLKSL